VDTSDFLRVLRLNHRKSPIEIPSLMRIAANIAKLPELLHQCRALRRPGTRASCSRNVAHTPKKIHNSPCSRHVAASNVCLNFNRSFENEYFNVVACAGADAGPVCWDAS
jgi:hypothetical protein